MKNLTQQISQMSPLKVALAAQKLAPKMSIVNAEAIAVIGMGCRFPGGVNNPEQYWQLLKEGKDAIVDMPNARWDVEAHYDPDPEAAGKMSTRHGGFINDVDKFDAQFFGISPREAAVLDPQQRLLLEVSWEALEHAGIVPAALHNTDTGVYIGITTSEYEKLCLQSDLASRTGNNHIVYMGTGNDTCAAAGRLSYSLGLTGPSMSVNTACSSSLVATHLACESLRQRTSNIAIAGGVNLTLIPDIYTVFSKAGMLSPDGRCKSFDAAADGYVRGEGCGIVILKRLSDAVADGDNILGLIRGSAVNQDGRSSGLTVPNGPSQQKVIQQALDNSGVTPSQVGYVEAHGTGTSLGDPIEVGALGNVFNTERENALLIGSAKTNIGHLESGAGAAGLIKTVLSLQHGEIPPNLHFEQPSPHIAWDDLNIEVVTETTPWPSERRIAGVSSFGYSGTNAHIVLEATPTTLLKSSKNTIDRPSHLFTLSARTAAALTGSATDYIDYLNNHKAVSLADICANSNAGRSLFAHRLAIVASSKQELSEQLSVFLDGSQEQPKSTTESDFIQAKIAFLFTGQGSQYAGMGYELYQTQPTFRQALDRCNELLTPELEYSLLDILYPEQASSDIPDEIINQTAYTQPALFSLEYALARLWQSWGIQPKLMLGHSVGEYAAACIAGVFSLEDGLRLIAARGRLMQALPQDGTMMAIRASEAQVKEAVRPYAQQVSLATLNGPESIVISGETAAVQRIGEKFTAQGISIRELTVSHAFHSPLMDPMLGEFEKIASTVSYHLPSIDIVSNVTGKKVSNEMTQAQYWVKHVREAVHFNAGMAELEAQGCNVFLEIGSQPTLLGMGKACVQADNNALWLPSLRLKRSDWQQMLASLGELFQHDVAIDWDGFEQDYERSFVHLPTYAFQRQRHWLPDAAIADTRSNDALLPLIDSLLQSPLLAETIVETSFSTKALPFLLDHQVFDEVVVPGASHLSMVLSGTELMHMGTCQLDNVVFPAPLVLPENNARTVQVIFSPEDQLDSTSLSFQLISIESGAPAASAEALTHATGELSQHKLTINPVSLDDLKHRCQEVLDAESIYDTAAEQHIVFGDSFRWVTGLWRGKGEALAALSLPSSIASLEGYSLHPGLLDACFQAAGVTLDESDSEETILPFMLKKMQVFTTAEGESWWCHVKQVDTYAWDLTLFDSQGQVIVSIERFEMRQVPRDALLQHQLADWLYDIDWQVQPLKQNDLSEQAGRWLIFTDNHDMDDDIAAQLAQSLHAQGQDNLLVNVHDGYIIHSKQKVSLNPNREEDFEDLIEDTFIQADIACLGVIYLCAKEQHSSEKDMPAKAQSLSIAALHLSQALVKSNLTAKLWFVTHGAQSLENEQDLHLAQAALWGFGRTLAIEQPKLACVCLDLPSKAETKDALDILLSELSTKGNEDQIAWRGGVRHVARLSQYQAPNLMEQPEGAYRIQLRDYGSPDELQLVSIDRCQPKADEVEIEVSATALNFRDVLNALGMLKTYYAEVLGIEHAKDIPLGFECAGKVTAIGSDVSRLKVGDEVLAATEGSFASFVTVEATAVAHKPALLSFEEAAGIPTAFLTAYYGLNRLAKLQKGERILIHSAAGGVGQAAVQLAHAVGAEVFATASTGKWQTLKDQGIQYVMNSRNLDFADEIMSLTDGQGVDVVLNSLNGNFIEKSFDVLASNGRLVEIGKIGVWSAQQVTEYRSDVIYYPFDLGEVTAEDSSLMVNMLDELMADFASQQLVPLPQTVFQVNDVANAYRYMQQTKHIGKVVLNFDRKAQANVQAESSYLITGGLGGLGLHVTQSLVDQGARHLVLTSRSGASSQQAQELIETLTQQGISISVVKADIANANDVSRLLAEAQLYAPLRGIIHAAGIIDDAGLLQQTSARFAEVMAPKVEGAWQLHTQTLAQNIDLDFFVCFSSIASLLGSPGQTNYSAANAVVDLLMQQRRNQGLAGLSINWGPWGETGMAADLSFIEEGLDKIMPDTGIQILDNLMQYTKQQSVAQVGVFPMNWSVFIQGFPKDQIPPFVEEMQKKVVKKKTVKAKKSSSSSHANILQAIQEKTSKDERLSLLIKHIGQLLNQVLELDLNEETPTNQHWNELGLDSLMTVELKNNLDRTLHVVIPLETIMQDATTELLAQMALESLNEKSLSDSNNAESENETLGSLITNTEADLDADVEMLRQIPQTYVDVEEQHNRQVLIDGEWRSDFASCNYLGMDLHPDVINSIMPALEKWGTHPSWTRAVASPGLYRELEKEIANLVGAPETLVFPSIHLLHMGVLPLLAGFNGVIIKDSSAHHSIYEACLRAQADGVEWVEFAHNDLDNLEKKLARYRPEQTKIIAIDGVYSMSGGFPPLPEMVKLAKQYNATIYLDDAHGFGVIGENPSEEMPYGYGGGGIVKYFDLDYQRDNLIYVAGLSKTFSSYGAFITCFDDAMRSRMGLAAPFIFSGPSPVASLASALAGLKVNRSEGDQMRVQVYKLTRKLVIAARAMGYEVDNDQYFPIVGVVIGDVDEVTEACQLLWKYNVLITPAIYPAVPMHRNLVRFSVTALNTEEEIDQAIIGLQAVWDMIHDKSTVLDSD